MPKPEEIRLPGTRGPAPYFVGYVTDQLVARYGAERVFGGGREDGGGQRRASSSSLNMR